ncbi:MULTISPECIES: hypothetical protein [Acidiphilium]|uniref:hypothetical protein n=1 Tax=Acidiphilium TaxID=522 RepID=UPI002585C502|nr:MULTISPECIES: hypothetical protein [Acidiphilium]HQT86364.1 hypothetical protein [Acidiphilium rubrum]
MTPDQLTELRPAGATVAAIEASLARIATERAAITARVESANRDRSRLAAEGGTAKQRSTIEATIADAAFDIEQVDLLEAEAKAALGPAREAEAESAAERAVIAAIEAEQRWAAWLATKYPGLAAQIAAGIALDKAALAARAIALQSSPGAIARLPHRALGYCGSRPIGIAGAVRLPATEPGTAPIAWGQVEIF